MNREKNKKSKEKKVFCFIKTFLEKNGYSPSFREIAGEFHCSVSTVHRILHALKDDGIISFEDDKNRTITIIKKEG